MPKIDDDAYFLSRARQERANAASAYLPEVADIHRRMAEVYERKVSDPGHAGPRADPF